MLFQSLAAGVFVILVIVLSTVLCSLILPLQKHIRHVISLSVGVLIGLLFFDLIPETLEISGRNGMYALIAGFLFFVLLSRTITHYHHHHDDEECEHVHGIKDSRFIIFGDMLHNAIDGVIIATAFMIDSHIGIATTVGIVLHELPQEIAEYVVLRNAGYSRLKTLLYNTLSASTILIGVLAGFYFLESAEAFTGILLGIASGNLLYVIISDIVPRVINSKGTKIQLFKEFALVITGLVLMIGILQVSHTHEDHRLDVVPTVLYS